MARLLVSILVFVVALAGAWWLWQGDAAVSAQSTPDATQAVDPPGPDPVSASPAPDVAAESTTPSDPDLKVDSGPDEREVTTTPVEASVATAGGVPIAAEHLIPEQPYATEQLASAQGLRSPEDYARFNPSEAPTAFDPATFAADPEGYLRIADSRRIWQVADSEADVPGLLPVGDTMVEAAPGARIQFAVETEPGAPATFNSSGLGAFANGLSTVSVQADADGIARTWFTVTPGTMGEVPIAAASPLRRGRVQFSVFVTE